MKIIAKLTFSDDLKFYSNEPPIYRKGQELVWGFEREDLLDFLNDKKPIGYFVETGIIVNLGIEWFSEVDVVVCKEYTNIIGTPSEVKIKLNSL